MLNVIARKTSVGSVEIFMQKPNGERSLYATFDRDDSNKPTYRNKYVTLNCFKYGIVWDKV